MEQLNPPEYTNTDNQESNEYVPSIIVKTTHNLGDTDTDFENKQVDPARTVINLKQDKFNTIEELQQMEFGDVKQIEYEDQNGQVIIETVAIKNVIDDQDQNFQELTYIDTDGKQQVKKVQISENDDNFETLTYTDSKGNLVTKLVKIHEKKQNLDGTQSVIFQNENGEVFNQNIDPQNVVLQVQEKEENQNQSKQLKKESNQDIQNDSQVENLQNIDQELVTYIDSNGQQITQMVKVDKTKHSNGFNTIIVVDKDGNEQVLNVEIVNSSPGLGIKTKQQIISYIDENGIEQSMTEQISSIEKDCNGMDIITYIDIHGKKITKTVQIIGQPKQHIVKEEDKKVEQQKSKTPKISKQKSDVVKKQDSNSKIVKVSPNKARSPPKRQLSTKQNPENLQKQVDTSHIPTKTNSHNENYHPQKLVIQPIQVPEDLKFSSAKTLSEELARKRQDTQRRRESELLRIQQEEEVARVNAEKQKAEEKLRMKEELRRRLLEKQELRRKSQEQIAPVPNIVKDQLKIFKEKEKLRKQIEEQEKMRLLAEENKIKLEKEEKMKKEKQLRLEFEKKVKDLKKVQNVENHEK